MSHEDATASISEAPPQDLSAEQAVLGSRRGLRWHPRWFDWHAPLVSHVRQAGSGGPRHTGRLVGHATISWS
jgi:hypothetical protein